MVLSYIQNGLFTFKWLLSANYDGSLVEFLLLEFGIFCGEHLSFVLLVCEVCNWDYICRIFRLRYSRVCEYEHSNGLKSYTCFLIRLM